MKTENEALLPGTSEQTLTQRVAEALRRRIRENPAYRPGEKLPNENDLSSELGISRTTLREAIRILVSEEVLVVYRGRGTYVADHLDKEVTTRVDIPNATDRKVALRDLYETRMIIEPAAAALACRRASEEELAEILRLGEICQERVLNDPAGPERTASESAFHGAILKASHNEFLAQFMPLLNDTISQTLALNFNLEVLAEDAYKDHAMIMEFLRRRDEEALKGAVVIHLRHALWHENLLESTDR